jgi:hypothetical protein
MHLSLASRLRRPCGPETTVTQPEADCEHRTAASTLVGGFSRMIARVQLGDLGTWMGALATLLAVLVALIVAFWPTWRDRRRRPVLLISVGEIEPFERPVFESGELAEVRLRVSVTNEGRSTARRVRVRIEGWWSYMHGQIIARTPGERVPKWLENAIDPFDAEWVGQASAVQPVLELDLLPKSRELVELLCFHPAKRELALAVDPRRAVRFLLTGGPYGEQLIAVSASCENGYGMRRILSCKVTEGPRVDATNTVTLSPIHNVHFADEPDRADVLRRGLGGLWPQVPPSTPPA